MACGSEPFPEAAYHVRTETPGPVAETPCASRNPDRNAYFGDLHVHTSLSSDAWMFDVRLMPDDAYRYARGQTIEIYSGDPDKGMRTARIDRPPLLPQTLR